MSRRQPQPAMSAKTDAKTVKLPAELAKRLKILAVQRDTTIQALLEEAVRKYLKEQEQER